PWHRLTRFRDLSAALAGDGEHFPAALVPPQHRQRVHGPDRRRLRRQGRRLLARWRLASQLHERSRARCRDLGEGNTRRYLHAGSAYGHHGLHVRDPRGDSPDALCAREPAAPARLCARVAGVAPTVRPARCGWRLTRCSGRSRRPRQALLRALLRAAAGAQAITAVSTLNATHDPAMKSWVASANAPAADFPLQNLPFAAFRRAGSGESFRGGVGIGDAVLDLGALHALGVLQGNAAQALALCTQPTLNAFMA